MTGEYSSKSWFWEFLKMYVKLLIMCCLTFFEYDIPNKVIFFLSLEIDVFVYFISLQNSIILDIIHFLVDGMLWVDAILPKTIHP